MLKEKLINICNIKGEPDICIGIFQTKSRYIEYGRKNIYDIDLTNCTGKTRKVFISFDIYKSYTPKPSIHPDDHHAFFNKRIILDKNSTKLQIEYDWCGNIEFTINGSKEKCDEKWIGPADGSGLYAIYLVLYDNSMNKKSELILMQTLTNINENIYDILKLVDMTSLTYLDIHDGKDVNKGYKNIIVLQGKDKEMVNKTMDYFLLYQRKKNNFRLFVPHLDNEINKNADYGKILGLEDISYMDALKHSIMLCDPSIYDIDLSCVINGWINKIPVLIHKDSILKDLCSLTDTGLYFKDYDEFEACLDFLFSNETIRKKMGRNNVQFGLGLYAWLTLLHNVK